MSTENAVKLINTDTQEMVKSPARKRARYDSLEQNADLQERWSLHKNDVGLDEIVDFGVGRLDSSSECAEEEKSCDESKLNYVEGSYVQNLTEEEKDKQIAILESTLSKETLRKLSQGEWNSLLNKTSACDQVDKINHFECLSDEVILYIFNFLPKRFLCKAALVCRRWYQLVQDESLWTRMDVSGRQLPPGTLGQILSRQVLILRLAQSEILHPPILPGIRAADPYFRARLLYLDLSMAHVSPTSLTVLFNKCQRLKKLSLEHAILDDNVLLALSSNTDLEVLNLAMVEGVALKGLTRLLTNCHRLKELNLAWTYLDVNCVRYICSNLPRTIDRLNISGCRKQLDDDDVLNLAMNCPNLRELDLSDCTGVTGKAVQHITMLEELNFLALSRCYFIPYRSLTCLKQLPSLVYLDVHGGYIDTSELTIVQDALGPRVHINKFKFSSVARPTVGPRRSSIWGLRVRD